MWFNQLEQSRESLSIKKVQLFVINDNASIEFAALEDGSR